MKLLEVRDIETFYGPSQALFGLSLEVNERECVTLIGRNGMGKSTTVKTVMGMMDAKAGDVSLAGERIKISPDIGIGMVHLSSRAEDVDQLLHEAQKVAEAAREP